LTEGSEGSEGSRLSALGSRVSALGFPLHNYRRTARLFWAVTICLASIPFESFQTHTHWDKIGWIPFYSWPVRPLDVVANIALYVPLGYLATGRSRYVRVAAEAFLLSLTMEVIQDFSHSRFPSATDLVCNITGALLGVALANRLTADRSFQR